MLELAKDIEELQLFKEKATRKKVKLFITKEIERLEFIIEDLKKKQKSETKNEQVKTIHGYSWD